MTIHAFSSALGAGYWNTRKMLAGCTSGLAYDMTATYGGKSDWYLPNKVEWEAMWAARANLSGYFVDGNGYMASEEQAADWAYELYGSAPSGGAGGTWATYGWYQYTKTGLNPNIYSRAIRAF